MSTPASPSTTPAITGQHPSSSPRRRVKRARISDGKRQRGLQLLQLLLNLEASHAEFSKQLQLSIEAVRKETERTRTSDRDLVFLAVERGFCLKSQIVAETGLTEWDVRKILVELEELDLINVRRQRQGAGDDKGKPVLLYMMHDTPVGSAFFLSNPPSAIDFYTPDADLD